MAAPRIAGVAYFKADGNQFALRGNFTVSPSPLERKMIAGQDYVHGYSEDPRVPFIEGDVSLVPGMNIEDVDAMINVTITAELANGKVYVLKEGVCKAAHELQSKEGQVRIRFEGTSCDEIS